MHIGKKSKISLASYVHTVKQARKTAKSHIHFPHSFARFSVNLIYVLLISRHSKPVGLLLSTIKVFSNNNYQHPVIVLNSETVELVEMGMGGRWVCGG